ncbi:MAG: PQQ-dependent sugar dehydrogenase [Flavobacteriaceae bacterium]|nr:PQQ-dependent sugar dehydrogenase [Flavobacteriaceae bacterium]
MKKIITVLFISITFSAQSQSFERSELPTPLSTPWEIIYGPDDYLWLTERGGNVSRVHPVSGDKTIVYTAPDYFSGSALENRAGCNKSIRSGTLGLALDPDFTNPANSFIYYVYSYNSGTVTAPATKFKIKRLQWDAVANQIIAETDLVSSIPTGYGHIGGRLLAVKQNEKAYLFFSSGDFDGAGDNCYVELPNPINYTQDPTTQNGKIHRYNIDGTIPNDNPILGNSFYTRGHRNPQGLMYNPNLDILYSIEHGPETDDEINILYKGMNYGWSDVSGFHDDNYAGEMDFIANYSPHPNIANDSLVQPFYAWGTTYNAGGWLDWPTVAPSDGIYYNSNGIPEWKNSLLVVTLKNGNETDQELYQFQLTESGEIAPSTQENPNPKRFFGADQALNGRLRDVAFSKDGKTIYLINNKYITEKISVYTYSKEALNVDGFSKEDTTISITPNPTSGVFTIDSGDDVLLYAVIYNKLGQKIKETTTNEIDISNMAANIYFVKIILHSGKIVTKKIIKK